MVLSNVHEVSQHDYGRDFRETLCTIRQTYKHDHTHDDASLTNLLQLLTSADSLRDPAEAPAHEAAHAVFDSMAMLSDFCQEVAEEYNEEALAVSGSDSDPSCDKQSKARNKDRRNGRDNCRRSGGRSRSKSRDKSQSVTNHRDNPCKYCRKYRRLAVHQAKEEHCYWNKKLSVFRPKCVCEEMGIQWKPAYRFSSDSEDGSESK